MVLRFRSAMHIRAAVGRASSKTATPNGSIENRKTFKGRGSLAYQPVNGDNDVSWKDECDQQRHGGGLAFTTTTSREETANGRGKNNQAQAHTEGTSGVGLLEPTERAGAYEYKHDVATATPDSTSYDISGGNGSGSGGGDGGLAAVTSPQGLPEKEEDIGVCGPGGLMATPNLKIILLIVCLVQVRRGGERGVGSILVVLEHISMLTAGIMIFSRVPCSPGRSAVLCFVRLCAPPAGSIKNLLVRILEHFWSECRWLSQPLRK